MNHYKIFLLLVVALAVRLYNFNAPLIGARGWRQADTMAMAINFHENGYDFFYPQIDWGGETPGYVESEFPIYSYLSAILFGVFGVSEAIPRLLSIAFSLIGIGFYYALVREQVDAKTAFWSSLLISILPLNVYMARMVMPESLLMMALILGVYFFTKWSATGRWSHFALSVVFTSLACLIKIPSLYIGLPIFYLAWLKFGKGVFLQYKLWIYALIVLGLTAAWYYHAHQTYLQHHLTFGIWEYGTDKWGNWDLILTWGFWRRIWVDSLGQLFFVWFGYPVFIAGLFLRRYTPQEKVFDLWIAGVLVYFIIVSKGNFVHDYYQLPFTFPAAVYLGKVYARYLDRGKLWLYASLLLVFGAIFVTGAYVYDNVYLKNEDPETSEKYELAQYIREYTDKDDLIIVLDNGDPTVLYLSDRKGWHAYGGAEFLIDLALDEKIGKGAEYLAGRRDFCDYSSQCDEFNNLLEQYEFVFKNRKYFIARLAN